ncbi:GxxExxY protein [uncultured Desulfuromusa sp.]|uniref:GxxExxY protein n=1 Tax=uncultured Desulfuromusa sp. TaxID=219183 RepID=UPI003747E457
MTHELKLREIGAERQISVPIVYKGHSLKTPLFLDLFITKQIIVEVKSVEKLNPVFNAQLLTYLRLTDIPLGLIVNFGEQYIKNGFHRVVNNFPGE